MNISWPAVARDVLIVIFLTFLGGFVIGVASAGREISIGAIAISNLIFGSVGFCIAGCLNRSERWKHLFIVGFFTWMISLINVLFFNVSLQQWFLAPLAILVMIGVGGGLSFLFARPSPPAPPAV